MSLKDYVAQVRARLGESGIVIMLEVVDVRVLLNRGYFRARLGLSNGDFLEVAESFAVSIIGDGSRSGVSRAIAVYNPARN
jgi:hypothetical protein